MSEKYKIIGGNALNGSIICDTSKNSTLPIIAGSIMCNDIVYLKNLPKISDVNIMFEIITQLGCKFSKSNNDYLIDPTNINNFNLPTELTHKIRSSIFLLGPLLTIFKKANVVYPGGCDIGSRPIDLHLKGLKKLNVRIREEHGFIYCDGSNMKANTVFLDFPSVGATENLIMASVKLKGITKILNSAKEPEIVDLQNFLNSMGAKIRGAGTDTIIIEGVKELKTTTYQPITDRIVAGTYLLAGAITGGNVEICNTNYRHLEILLEKLKNIGCKISINNDKIYLKSKTKLKHLGQIITKPYPFFPTDLQPQIVALSTILNGTSIIEETMFETRFKHISQLQKMGANIVIKDKCAIIRGVKSLSGAETFATDLRAGAGLVLAGLRANGYTTINNINYIERGYCDFDKNLKNLGANIEKINE